MSIILCPLSIIHYPLSIVHYPFPLGCNLSIDSFVIRKHPKFDVRVSETQIKPTDATGVSLKSV